MLHVSPRMQPNLLSALLTEVMHAGVHNIRIHHECEDRIEKISPEDRRLASRGLPSDDKR